ncbi:hypothetical protein A0H81_06889 [Grifola frondosa]|uniref:Uncharacterized protein n=1 Tax=Grifola frondosa TaxID=5627 RepID=A0A1C7M7E5_GRIFR|nr:hypothetical protein A0H81_06889 [Grifola frondosa]
MRSSVSLHIASLISSDCPLCFAKGAERLQRSAFLTFIHIGRRCICSPKARRRLFHETPFAQLKVSLTRRHPRS